MNALTHSRRLLSVVLIAAIAASCALGFASPAHAKHVKVSFAAQACAKPAIVTVSSCAPVVRCAPVAQCAPARPVSREYLRGLEAGRCAGFDEGFSDGLRGRCFDSCPVSQPCHVSRQFLAGYLDGYSRGYAAGYDKGDWERRNRCHRPCWTW